MRLKNFLAEQRSEPNNTFLIFGALNLNEE
jgi:hypothetical protein